MPNYIVILSGAKRNRRISRHSSGRYPRIQGSFGKGAGTRRVTEVWQHRSDGYLCAAVRLLAKHPSCLRHATLFQKRAKEMAPRIQGSFGKGAVGLVPTEDWNRDIIGNIRSLHSSLLHSHRAWRDMVVFRDLAAPSPVA